MSCRLLTTTLRTAFRISLGVSTGVFPFVRPSLPSSSITTYPTPACANGEVAPFMGHNAFLRWKAIQDSMFIDPADGKQKIWSESNVSEDFDMALRLILKGYIVRWATYSKGMFKEGVSLSVDDELNRWQKYSYGCNECVLSLLLAWCLCLCFPAGCSSTPSFNGGVKARLRSRFTSSCGPRRLCITRSR